METTTPDVLTDFEVTYVPAGTGKRFLNLLIDVIVFYVFFFFVGMLLAIFNPEAAQEYASDVEAGRSVFSQYLIAYVVLISYYTLTEGLFKGKSIAKFITSTRAVNEDGSYISFSKAFLRSLCRIVPFEWLSIAFGALWHDSWTNTTVIDEKQTIRN
jgi:uncharacterized RDD family membrane protein YckC